MGVRKKETVEITGLAPRMIQFYIDQKVVTPRIRGEGRGAIRTYTRDNLLVFAIIRELLKYGMTVSIIKSVVEKIQAGISKDGAFYRYNAYKMKGKKKLSDIFLVIFSTDDEGFEIDFTESNFNAIELNKCQSFLTINYSNIIRRLNSFNISDA